MEVSEIKEFLAQEKISQSTLARSLGVSTSTISQLLAGKYAGSDIVAQNVTEYIKRYREKGGKRAVERVAIYESRDKKMAEFVIDEAVREREFALLYGEAGTGKTTVVSEWAKRNPNALLLEATPHFSAGEVLEELCEMLSLQAPKNLNKRLKVIAHALRRSDRVLLIDEAEHLSLRALEDLRRIADFARVPLILSGTEILLRNLMGKRGELKQLYSRLCGKWHFRGLSKKESDECFGAGIFEYARGNFRTSSKLLSRARRLAELHKSELNKEIIKSATEMIVLA